MRLSSIRKWGAPAGAHLLRLRWFPRGRAGAGGRLAALVPLSRRARGWLPAPGARASPGHRGTAFVRWIFLRTLGGTYLVAFTSLGAQVLGLYGQRGILPIRELLDRVRELYPREGVRLLPSLLWLDASDDALVKLCRAGQALSAALILGISPRLTATLLWALYLSFHSVGRDFLSFQWDILLLEAGLLAVLLAPPGVLLGRNEEEPSAAAVALMRWLAARLHLESGIAKLASGDETWRKLTALDYYYETAPLPTRPGWYAHHLPHRVQQASTVATFVGELAVPLLAFGPRRGRLAAFWSFTALQLAFATTGNYGFFNLLSFLLNLWLLDDDALRRVLPLPVAERPRPEATWRRLLEAAVALPLAALSLDQTVRFGPRLLATSRLLAPLERRLRKLLAPLGPGARRLTAPVGAGLRKLRRAAVPLRAVNPYGLFSVMTTERPEISVEGSDDGVTWREYRFRYKVQDPDEPPRRVAPHQPRLDWQMWFAALGSPPSWFVAFLARLLQGVPEVLALLRENPFPEKPPRYVRAVLYRYKMTDLKTHRETSAWWRRERLGLYVPPLALGGAVV